MEKLRIVHTNDLHSHFEQFPKIKRYLHQAQNDKSVDQTFTFDAGDFMDRSLRGGGEADSVGMC